MFKIEFNKIVTYILMDNNAETIEFEGTKSSRKRNRKSL